MRCISPAFILDVSIRNCISKQNSYDFSARILYRANYFNEQFLPLVLCYCSNLDKDYYPPSNNCFCLISVQFRHEPFSASPEAIFIDIDRIIDNFNLFFSFRGGNLISYALRNSNDLFNRAKAPA